MPEILLLLLIVLIAVTLIGHGLWAVLAMIFRAIFGGDEKPPTKQQRCVFCGRMTTDYQQRCDWCGRHLGSPMANELSDLDALMRQLRRFRSNQSLKPEVVENMLTRVERYRRRLLEGPPAAAPPRPAAEPVVPSAPDVPSTPPPQEQTVAVEIVEEPLPAPPKPPKPKPKPAKPQAAPRPRPPVMAPPPPRKSWAEMLAGFMEQRNIRWGELIGGLLIVGSSVALVLSLLDTLREIPYFPFLIALAITSAVFGVGLYAHHRWKLESTSRGLLITATLLVPLSFLVMAWASKDESAAMTVAMELVALGAFAALIRFSGEVLVPGGRWWQVLGVLGGSAGTLLAVRWVAHDSPPWWFITAGALPAVCFVVAVVGYLYGLSPRKRLDQSQVHAVLTLLGTALFALMVALGLLVSRADGATAGLDRVSLLVALAALPILAGGLSVRRGTEKDDSLAPYHTAGTTVALVGVIVMLAALGMAWPHPLGIAAVGGLSAATLVLAAFYYRLPVLHAGAIACVVMVYLIAVHLAFSGLPAFAEGADPPPELLKLTLGGRSGTALGFLFIAFGMIAELLARRGRHRHGRMYAGGSAAVALVGLLLVTFHGLRVSDSPDPVRAAVLYAVYGGGCLALVARWRRVELGYLGLNLLASAPMWLLWWMQPRLGQTWAPVLGAEALIMAVVAALLHRHYARRPQAAWKLAADTPGPPAVADLYRVPLLRVAEVLAPLAVLAAIGAELWAAAPVANCPWPVLAAGLIAAFYLLAAWGYRSPQRTWVGSMVVLAGLVHTLTLNYTDWTDRPWPSLAVALLTHATLAVAVGLVLTDAVLDAWKKRRAADLRDGQPAGEALQHVFGRPLSETALLSSALTLVALPVELLGGQASTVWVSCCLFWLAAIWLVIAWRKRDALLLSAHQVMLTMAALTAVTAWLKHPQAWVESLPGDLFHPHSLQAYGLVLGLLSLAWVAVRIALRESKTARKLLDPEWPAVDWIVRHAVVWLQLLLLVSYRSAGLQQELLPAADKVTPWQTAACGSGAWTLLGLLTVTWIAALWQRWSTAELLSGLLLAATLPCLIAGQFVGQLAVGSALRWGLASCFIACSAAVWLRRDLLRACRRVGATIEVDSAGPRIARAALVVVAALPVLVVTVQAASLQLSGTSPAGPLAGTFFDRLGPAVSYLVPLGLVTLGLVGHAVRERSAGYAFSAGLVVELMVTLGYALWVENAGDGSFDNAHEYVTLLQLFTIAAAAWAACWLAVRRRLDIWREEPRNDTARVLMNVQLGMAAAGNVLLLGAALATLAILHPRGQHWTIAAGKPLGWIALVSAAAVYVYRRVQLRRPLSPQIVGLLGMTVLGLLACTVQWLTVDWQPTPWGYRTLMLGWAVYSLLVVLATWWVATVRTLPDSQGPPQALIRTAAVWVRISGIAAVVLGLKASLLHDPWQELLWAAASIAIASSAGAAMAVWRRREGWAFSAALGVNLAASLVVWYFHRHYHGFGHWWLRLVQANVIASAAVALVWLAVRRRLYQLRELTLGQSPLLATQTVLPVIGNVLLLVVPVAWLLLTPDRLSDDMTELMGQMAQAPGWLALLLSAAAAAWYLRQAVPGNLLHVLGGLGLAAGVLLACHTTYVNVTDRPAWNLWMEYHTLIAAWTAVGSLLLAVGLWGGRLRLSPQKEQLTTPAAAGPVLPKHLVQAWVTTVGVLVVGLSVIHSAGDPVGVWWYLGAILTVSAIAGVVAIWLRRPAYVFISGLLLSVIGVIAWMTWGQPSWQVPALAALVQTNVLCLAAGCCAWTLLELVHPRGVPHTEVDGRPLPFAHLAARAAVGLLAAMVFVGVVSDVLGLEHIPIKQLDWLALAGAVAAAGVCLWDRQSRWALPGLYALGLAAVGMGLCQRDLAGQAFCHAAAVELAVFVLATAGLGRALPLFDEAWQGLRIPADNRRWPPDWFPTVSAVVTAVAAGLSVWISIDAAFDGMAHQGLGLPLGQTAGPLCVAVLLPAAVLVAGRCRGPWRFGWQQGTLALALALLCESGFVWLLPQQAPWLHRSVILMVAAVAMTLLSGMGLRRLLGESSDWAHAGRRLTPAFGCLAVIALGLVLVQEAYLFHPDDGAPMTSLAIAVVVAALLALATVCIAFAVRADWDPLGLSDQRRQAYVYAAELLAGLIGLHICLTMPWLFHGYIRQFWMLIVMAVAFVGAGLSEWFRRRGVPVLAKPLERTALLLPLAPAIGYWVWLFGFTEDAVPTRGLMGPAPIVWFVVGLFYGFMSVTRRSITLGVLGAVAANVGLWTLWYRQEWYFHEHPQLWLIPVALAALVAEHLDRRRLNEAQRTAVRYVALAMIYISSTVEFWTGLDSVWLPLAAILLSLAGVLAGVLLRVRSFLFVGVTCLAVVIVRIIHYAAFERGHMWFLWTCCIVLGAAIFALFAFFEKRRNDVLAAVERLKDWKR